MVVASTTGGAERVLVSLERKRGFVTTNECVGLFDQISMQELGLLLMSTVYLRQVFPVTLLGVCSRKVKAKPGPAAGPLPQAGPSMGALAAPPPAPQVGIVD